MIWLPTKNTVFSSSSKDTGNVNAPFYIIVVDDDVDDIDEVAPTKTKKGHPRRQILVEGRQASHLYPITSSASGKRRKSIYWKHYDETSVEGEIECKYCEQLLHVCSKNGTSVLKNHLQKCKKYPANVDQKQKLFSFQMKRVVKEDGSIEHMNVPSCWKFDPKVSGKELAKMIVIDELSFMFVERAGNRGFCMSLHPNFGHPSRHTIERLLCTLY
ncbi:LOW QUALITY PROTEIN: hypothetical protein Cgig2_008475 [Carnegiea gigantea]|uniref:BED-type domain-containing protein n=1 Tax=Carnegiea gigantea TaxID=171969 RepID=A0A9Q1JG22_9CARY|nr:LOW QUALITY PROTEIN: hypothetical protein Cgig2_008475 [Carnegiea gigantea]